MTAKRQLRTYAIRKMGVAAIVEGPDGRELRFPGDIIRSDGTKRRHEIVVRPTTNRPSLVDDVVKALDGGRTVRMVAGFERTNYESNGLIHMRINAVIENILDGYRQPDARQLDLFA